MQEWLVGATPSIPEILDQTDRVGAKLPIFDIFSLVATQPLHLAKKVQLTLIGSPLRAFQWAQDKHRTVRCPYADKGWLENAKCPKFEQ